jgi:hypothetical protein
MKKIVSVLLAIGFGAVVYMQMPHSTQTVNASHGIVRMPVPLLCPSQTKYYTACTGYGAGCDMTDCGSNEM